MAFPVVVPNGVGCKGQQRAFKSSGGDYYLISKTGASTIDAFKSNAGSYDDNISSVSLLLKCEGSDASTTFTDSGPTGHTVTANGDCQIDTAQFKFGSASGLWDGTGDFLTIPSHSDFIFGSGDFTIEFWMRLNATGSIQDIYEKQPSAGAVNGVYLRIESDNTVSFFASTGTVTWDLFQQKSTSTVTTGQWYHICYMRSGTGFYLFINGTLEKSNTLSGTLSSNSENVSIGCRQNGVNPFNGWLDEFRITKGVARYSTSGFTPPTAGFPTTGYFTAQDISNNPSSFTSVSVVTAQQSGDNIHVGSYDSGVYRYHAFSMSSDTWTTTSQTIEDVSSAAPNFPWIDISARSDGDVVAVYAGATEVQKGDQKERVDVNVRTSGTWGGPTALDGGGDIHYGNPTLAKDPSTDDMHIFWSRQDSTANDPPIAWNSWQGRTLDSTDTLSTVVTDNPGTERTSDLLSLPNIVSYDNSGTLIRSLYSKSAGSFFSLVYSAVDAGNDISGLGSTENKLADDPYVSSEASIHTVGENSGVIYILFSGGGTSGVDQDIYFSKSSDDGVTWDTSTEIENGVTCNFITGGIYTNGSNTVFGYQYDNGGTLYYNEYTILTGSQTLTPSLFTNTNSFFTPTVSPGAVTLTPSLYADADTFYTHTVAFPTQNLDPSLYTDTDTFFTPTVSTGTVNLAPSLYSDDDTFYTPTVSPGSVDLQPSLYTDDDTFFTPTVTSNYDLQPSLYSDTDAFFTHTVSPGAVDLQPSLYTDTDTFFTATVSPGAVDLQPSLYSDADTFFTHSISLSQNLSPSLYIDDDTFFTPTVSPGAVTLTPSLYADADTFYTHTLASTYGLTPSLYTDADSFFTPTVTSTYDLQPSLYADADAFFSATVSPGAVTLTPSLYSDDDTFYTPIVSQASQILQPSLYSDADTFYSPAVTSSYDLQPSLYSDGDSFFTPTVTTTYDLAPSLYADGDTFFTPTVSPGAINLDPSLYSDADTFYSHALTTTINLTPALYTNNQAFFTHTITLTYDLSPALYVDADAFFTHTVSPGAVNLAPALYTDPDNFFNATVSPGAVSLTASLHTDPDSFFSATITATYDLQPSLYSDTDVFFTHTVTPGAVTLTPSLYSDSDTFYTHVVNQINFELLPALYTDADTFYNHTVSPGSVDLTPSLYTDPDTFFPFIVRIPKPTQENAVNYVPGIIQYGEDLNRYLEEELWKVKAAIDILAAGHLTKTYVEPDKREEGDLVYADGTTWNPGSGAGIYQYRAGAWVHIG